MSENAYLPCFVCGRIMQNAFIECDNQPWEGTEFRTQGHYGSTFWDSFDGEDLVLNVCDRCLSERKDRLGQQKVSLPITCEGLAGFGMVRVDRPLVAYTGNLDTSTINVEPEDLGDDRAVAHAGAEVRWASDIAVRQQWLLSELEQQ